MRKPYLSIFLGIVVAGLIFLAAEPCQAQSFMSQELLRQLSPGASFPHEGETLTQRYGYNIGAPFYPGFNTSRFSYLEYLDRLDRQEKFGHLWPSRKYGSDYQVEMIQREYWQHTYGRYGSGWRLFRRGG